MKIYVFQIAIIKVHASLIHLMTFITVRHFYSLWLNGSLDSYFLWMLFFCLLCLRKMGGGKTWYSLYIYTPCIREEEWYCFWPCCSCVYMFVCLFVCLWVCGFVSFHHEGVELCPQFLVGWSPSPPKYTPSKNWVYKISTNL